jgi:hypothetical protein
MKKIIIVVTFIVFVFISQLEVEADYHKIQSDPLNSEIVSSLRQGGYILFVRHGEATVGNDKPDVDFSDCTTQKNLSQVGRMQATAYGEVIRKLLIPIQYPIEASPFCRTKETAEIAFGKEHVVVDPFWVNTYKLSGELSDLEKKSILKSLTSVLEMKPSTGKNKVIVDHAFPSDIGLGEIPNMGTVLVRPRGQGNGYEVVAKISLEEFLSYLQEY